MKGPSESRASPVSALGLHQYLARVQHVQFCKIQNSLKSPHFRKTDEKLIKQTFGARMKGSWVLHDRVGGKVRAGVLYSWRRSRQSSVRSERERKRGGAWLPRWPGGLVRAPPCGGQAEARAGGWRPACWETTA